MIRTVFTKIGTISPSYRFFWKKTDKTETSQQQDQQQQQSQTQQTQEQSNKWQGKEEYLKDLRQRREEYERIKDKASKEAQSQTIRQAREYEVEYGKVDYAKVLIDNINLRTLTQFKHPDELFNFISTIKVKLTEENLMECVAAMINLSDQLTEQDLFRYEYHEFLHVLTKNIRILSKNTNLQMVAQLLDLHCVATDHLIWREFELIMLGKLNSFKLHELQNILTHFSNQREGSDQLWDSCENYIKGLLEQETGVQQLDYAIKIIVAYWRVMRGTKPFATHIFKTIMDRYADKSISSQVPINSLIQTMTVISGIASKQDSSFPINTDQFKSLFNIIEKELIPKIDQLEFEQICVAAAGFGLSFGSQAIFNKLEVSIIANMDKYHINEVRSVIKGFLLTYRGSKKLIPKLMQRVQNLKHEFSVAELSQIVKAVYITENDNEEFYADIEKKIVQRMKDVKVITIQEISDIAQSYLITRIGSREMYKLLEILITYRFDDLRQDSTILGRLHDLYQKTGLCDPNLILRMAQFL